MIELTQTIIFCYKTEALQTANYAKFLFQVVVNSFRDLMILLNYWKGFFVISKFKS